MTTIEQYNTIRAVIRSNLQTIKSLLAQANSLHQVVIELDDNIESDEKKKLNDSLNNIYKSIDLLVMQTDVLLKTFVAYANAKEGAGV